MSRVMQYTDQLRTLNYKSKANFDRAVEYYTKTGQLLSTTDLEGRLWIVNIRRIKYVPYSDSEEPSNRESENSTRDQEDASRVSVSTS